MQSPERTHHNFNAFATVVVTTVVPVVLKDPVTTPS
jgi:hypothetical protein